MGYNDVNYAIKNGVGYLTFNRPQTLNALNGGLMAESTTVINEAARDDAVKALVVTGAGRGFCSGADLSALNSSGEGRTYPGTGRRNLATPFGGFGELVLALHNFPKPSIAAVNGVAAGGGLSVALGCDMIVASDKATFSAIFVRRGLVPDMGISYFLPRLIGTKKACEMLFTGKIIDALEADRIGIVNRVVPHDELLSAAEELASTIATGASVAIELAKESVYRGISADLPTQLGFEAWAQGIAHNTADSKEAIRAFLEKRQPKYAGR